VFLAGACCLRPYLLTPYGVGFILAPLRGFFVPVKAQPLPSFARLHGRDARAYISRPERSIQRPILNRFGDVFGLKAGGAFEIGDSAGYLQDAVVGAGGKALL
jgi:hypothetical protein